MSYLERLLELEKKSGMPQVPDRHNCQKPANPAFDPFDSSAPGASQNFNPAHQAPDCGTTDAQAQQPTELPKATWWRIYRNGEFVCVMMDPHGLTRDEAVRVARLKWLPPTSVVEKAARCPFAPPACPNNEIEVKR